ncbi:hypothetical protein ANCDUO_11267 [Ancylostoma duodenale]|uniref:Uncharacterized protein n=1 Tax=Ancylostoma duodenale TaxID=51022 RepID=A0A0C2GBV7_9BILA|nr:hypothetical protein ANCDUO_11267 [Ancylostoma duodenale]
MEIHGARLAHVIDKGFLDIRGDILGPLSTWHVTGVDGSDASHVASVNKSSAPMNPRFVLVLECHGFICTNNKAANALVRCCFHAYADSIYLKMDEKVPGLKAIKEGSTGERSPASPQSEENNSIEGDDHVDRAPKNQ